MQSFQTARSGDPSPGAPQLRGRREVQSPVAVPGPGPRGGVPRTGAAGPRRFQPERRPGGEPPERPVSHRPQHGVGRRRPRQHLPAPRPARARGSRRPQSFASPSPARRRPVRPDPYRTYPARRGRRRRGCDSSSSSPTPGTDSACSPAPASQGAWGPARPARSGRGGRSRSQVTSPLLQSNPTTAAPAGFTPARAPARPRPSAKHGHEHNRPALSSRFPRPAHRLALPLHPHATARGAGPSAEATPTGGPSPSRVVGRFSAQRWCSQKAAILGRLT